MGNSGESSEKGGIEWNKQLSTFDFKNDRKYTLDLKLENYGKVMRITHIKYHSELDLVAVAYHLSCFSGEYSLLAIYEKPEKKEMRFIDAAYGPSGMYEIYNIESTNKGFFVSDYESTVVRFMVSQEKKLSAEVICPLHVYQIGHFK